MRKKPIRNSQYKTIPIFKQEVIKNPHTLFPIEEIYDEDRYYYEEEPIFDNKGNYIATKRNKYLIVDRLVGCYKVRKNKNNDNKKSKPLFELKSNVEKELI